MYQPDVISRRLHRLLIGLFCLYAFSMPFELVLEIVFDVDTIFKPFRIFSLLILSVYTIQVFREGLYINFRDRSDWFLYGVLGYGILISLVQIIIGVFDFGLFYNDLFQIGLHAATFFIFKSTKIQKSQFHRIIKYFLAGLIINSAYTFINFFILRRFGRLAGFTDNPNYAALGLVAGITLVFLLFNYTKGWRIKLFYLLITMLFLYSFVISGSRSGLILFLIVIFSIVAFSSFYKKIIFVIIFGVIGVLLVPRLIENNSAETPFIMLKRVHRYLNSEEEDVRFNIWKGVFRVLDDRGYAGLGIGQYKAVFPKYYNEEANSLIMKIVDRGYYLSTHNDYLAILTDYGLPALMLYIIFLFLSVKKAVLGMYYAEEDEEEKFIKSFQLVTLLCLMVFGLTAESFQHHLYWFLLMVSTKTFE